MIRHMSDTLQSGYDSKSMKRKRKEVSTAHKCQNLVRESDLHEVELTVVRSLTESLEGNDEALILELTETRPWSRQ